MSFSQSYVQLDILTTGSPEEISEYFSKSSSNLFDRNGNIISCTNYMKREKIEIILNPRIVTITTKDYSKEDLEIYLLENIFIANNKETYLVNYFYNDGTNGLSFQLLKEN